MKKLSSAAVAIFALFIGLLGSPANAVVGGTDATGSGFVVAVRVDLQLLIAWSLKELPQWLMLDLSVFLPKVPT